MHPDCSRIPADYSQGFQTPEVVEAAWHDAGDLVVVQGQRSQGAQAPEHAVVDVLDVVVGQNAAGGREFLS